MVAVLAGAACSGAGMANRVTWQRRALELSVRLDGEPIPDTKSGAQLHTVLKGQLVRIRHTENRNEHQLTVRSDDGRRRSLFLTLPSGVNPPFKAGERMRGEVHASWDASLERIRHAIVLRGEDGGPRLVLQDAGLLTEDEVPVELRSIDVEVEPIYTDVGRLSHYCYSVVEHRPLVLGPERLTVAPGDRKTLRVAGAPWLVVALENAKTVRNECEVYSMDRVSWLAVSTHN